MISSSRFFSAVIAVVIAAHGSTAQAQPGPVDKGASPPFEFNWLPDWKVEHVAFTWGSSGKPLGGPARWAVNGGMVRGHYPPDHAESGRIFFRDHRRHLWMMDRGQVWLIGGTDDLGHADGPAEFAEFCGTGVYGGDVPALTLVGGETVYLSDGGLRKVSRNPGGRWMVETVGGKGKIQSLASGETAALAELGGIGQMAGDQRGDLYFILAGGIARATPDGKVTMLITREKVNSDLASIYKAKWPESATPSPISLGRGEGCSLVVHSDGTVYGAGRTWPSAWKVTPKGQFVPIANYAPRSKMSAKHWGPFHPAYYEPHCCMGWSLTGMGEVLLINEIPHTVSRCEPEKDQVSVLMQDGTFRLEGKPWTPPSPLGVLPDGRHVTNAPGAAPSRSTWLQMRKEK